MKITKNTLTLVEYKEFIDTVVSAIFINDEYHPEYRDLFTKYSIVKYFTDYDFGTDEIDFEKFYDMCITDEIENIILTVMIEKPQYALIETAINEAIEFKKNMLYKQSAYSLTDTILAELIMKINDIVDKIDESYSDIDVKKLAETFTNIEGSLNTDSVVDALAEKGFLSKPNRQTRRKNITKSK